MSHPDDAHGLRIQLATALRERDEARALKLEEVMGATKRICDERDALRAALQKHGCHEVECGANKEEDDQFCTCGLTAALAGGGDRG